MTDELDAEYGTLMLHSEVRWLSKGKVVQLFGEITLFVESRNETYEELMIIAACQISPFLQI